MGKNQTWILGGVLVGVLAIVLLCAAAIGGGLVAYFVLEGRDGDAQTDLPEIDTQMCPDTHEPNESAEQARFMQYLAIESYICHPEDVDVFLTPATYGGSLLDFAVDLYDLPADYDLYVYYHGKEIARSTNRGQASEHVYYYSGPRTGNTYELKVVGAHGAFDANHPYRLRFTMNPGTPTPIKKPSSE